MKFKVIELCQKVAYSIKIARKSSEDRKTQLNSSRLEKQIIIDKENGVIKVGMCIKFRKK